MARKPRLISAPPARGGSDRDGWKQHAGSMFAYSPDDGPIGSITGPSIVDATFEAPDVDHSRLIAERERELGLPSAVGGAAYREPIYDPGPVVYARPVPTPTPIADLASLPDKFELVIERKTSTWKITSPVHRGLWKAGEDLPQVVHEALAALAEMVRVDGVQAQPKRRPR